MTSKIKSADGLTLIEIMLVMALIILGAVVCFDQYQKIASQRKVAQIQYSVTALQNALQQYYGVNCYWFLSDPNSYSTVYPISLTKNPAVVPAPVDSSPNPTLSNYITNAGLINNPYAGASYGPAAYTYQIDTRGDIPILSVSTQFPQTVSASLLSILQGLLKPSSVNKGQFTWSIILNQPVKNQFTGLNTNLSYVQQMAAGLWLDTSGRQYGMQYMTPNVMVNGGTSSAGSQFANMCAHWQVPSNRCKETGANITNPARCAYQFTP